MSGCGEGAEWVEQLRAPRQGPLYQPIPAGQGNPAPQGSYAVRYGSKVAQETKWVDMVLSGSR